MTKSHSISLIIVDMQNDLVLPNSPFRVIGAYETLPAVKKLLEAARSQNWPVFHVVREYRLDGVDIEWPRHDAFLRAGGYRVSGSRGAEIVAELVPRANEYRIVKPRFSAFMQTELDFILRRLGVQNVVICGTQYPNCIRATGFDALSFDYDVTIVTTATSAKSPDIAEANIRDLRNVGIRCVSLEELLADPAYFPVG